MNDWDLRFAGEAYRYGVEPNAFLQERLAAPTSAPIATLAASPLAQLHVIAAGDGEGRNSVWLAQQGYRVTAVDLSAIGLAKARRLAAERGVEIETELADLATYAPPPGSADAVALIYAHMPPAVRVAAHRNLVRALKPGGLLILEAFHPTQLGRPSGGPGDPSMLYTLEMLRDDFGADLDIVHGWEGEIVLDEGPGHQGPGWVTRLEGVRAEYALERHY